MKMNDFTFKGHVVNQLRDIWRKTFTQKKKILDQLIKEEIKKNANETYYDEMKKLISFYYNPKEQTKDEEIKKGLEIIQLELKLEL